MHLTCPMCLKSNCDGDEKKKIRNELWRNTAIEKDKSNRI